jgi:C-terminal processing protease CtpA/Prc
LFINPSLETIYLDFKKYPRFQEMHSFAAKLAELTKDQHIKRIIIDLRHNGGGDFFVGLALAWGLIVVDSLDWQKGMYVLIGRQTFSAAMSNAAQYRQILNATLVGEPTGANPVGYQDADTFNLPHSGWKVMYSKRLYKFQDKASDGVQPDINIPLEWNAYKMGEDNQLDWILNKIKADVTPLQKQPL